MRLPKYQKPIASLLGASVALACILGFVALGVQRAQADRAPVPDNGAGRCIYLPLKGAHTINDHALTLIDRDDNVAIVHLAWNCLDSRHRLLSLRPTSAAEAVCSRADLDTIVNSASDVSYPECGVTEFLYVGHLNGNGYIDGIDKADVQNAQ